VEEEEGEREGEEGEGEHEKGEMRFFEKNFSRFFLPFWLSYSTYCIITA